MTVMMITGSNSTNELTMSSREIASLTGKRHRDVTRDFRNMCEHIGVNVRNFARIYQDSRGRNQEEYLLNKELTITQVTGYDPKMRFAVVNRWIELEEKAREPKFQIPQTYAAALLEAGRLASELAYVEEKLSVAAPKAEVFDLVIEKKGLLNASQVGGTLGMSAQTLNKVLWEMGVYNKTITRAKVFNQWFVKKGYGKVKLHPDGFTQSLFTDSGELWVAEKLKAEGII